jgi:hypothetical protein
MKMENRRSSDDNEITLNNAKIKRFYRQELQERMIDKYETTATATHQPPKAPFLSLQKTNCKLHHHHHPPPPTDKDRTPKLKFKNVFK